MNHRGEHHMVEPSRRRLAIPSRCRVTPASSVCRERADPVEDVSFLISPRIERLYRTCPDRIDSSPFSRRYGLVVCCPELVTIRLTG